MVQLEEDTERHPGSPLVAIWEWEVAREPLEPDGGLVDELGVELVLADAGEWAWSADSASLRFGIPCPEPCPEFGSSDPL
jgi:hypothetical protein